MKVSKLNEAENIVNVNKWNFSSVRGILQSPKGHELLTEPRLSKLLYFLSLNMNSYVSRNYLIDNIWSDTIVNEESLTRAVSDLRKLLSENFGTTIKIETLRGHGYKLFIEKESALNSIKSKLNPNFGYAILILFFILILTISIADALGLIEAKFLVNRSKG
ncbi:winged helix-turn-helix domain-containing protein [Psychroserpens luteolus]|uniref:winged helix-turn-helix domain-containing protein n=1 Tax=Psychroserpens luteolus TaxID=2855840 RepID=UPI0021D3FE60|nr:helix-turn-helix domain-containing protein [Psychroserpens luteolus]MCD2257727.1 helix-turn-helix domain-containing protein [Psychroserpens luteolus]